MPRDVGAAIYGMITVGALLAAESTQRETYLATVTAVLVALVVYGLAHAYSDFASARLEASEPLRLRDFARDLGRQVPILLGAGVPLLVLLVSWLFGASLDHAVTGAIWSSAGMIVAVELVAGLRAKQTGGQLLLQTLFGALLGLMMIVLRVVLH